MLRRAVSTISREIKRNGGVRVYRAVKADKRAWAETLRPKPCKLVLEARLRKAVIVKLRGKELADHKRFKLKTDIDVYFCDPQSPWQRGSNEHTNRLLRQYFPKGTDLSVHSQAKLNADYETPAERFGQCVAATS